MIRHTKPSQRTTSLLRFYDTDTSDAYAPFSAICTLVWQEYGKVVWVEGFKGKITRAHLREMAEFFIKAGVVEVRAMRADHRSIPFGTKHPDGYRSMMVAEFAQRLGTAPKPTDEEINLAYSIVSLASDDERARQACDRLQAMALSVREKEEIAKLAGKSDTKPNPLRL